MELKQQYEKKYANEYYLKTIAYAGQPDKKKSVGIFGRSHDTTAHMNSNRARKP